MNGIREMLRAIRQSPSQRGDVVDVVPRRQDIDREADRARPIERRPSDAIRAPWNAPE